VSKSARADATGVGEREGVGGEVALVNLVRVYPVTDAEVLEVGEPLSSLRRSFPHLLRRK
jgi:hypothetical protein